MGDPEQQHTAFLQHVKSALDDREAQLDAETLRDLRLARHKALAGLQRPRRIWQPVVLASALAMAVIVVVTLQQLPVKTPTTPGAMEDMTLLSAGDDFDLYENLDFYQWLDQEKHNG